MREPAAQRVTDDRQSGQTTSEYAVILGILAIGLIVAVVVFRSSVTGLFEDSSEGEVFRPPTAACDANYSGACVPPYPPDLECSDISSLGADVTVVGSDPHGFDGNGDGFACNE